MIYISHQLVYDNFFIILNVWNCFSGHLQVMADTENHPVYSSDPRKLHALLNMRVTVTTKNKRSVTGFVQTIDPVSLRLMEADNL